MDKSDDEKFSCEMNGGIFIVITFYIEQKQSDVKRYWTKKRECSLFRGSLNRQKYSKDLLRGRGDVRGISRGMWILFQIASDLHKRRGDTPDRSWELRKMRKVWVRFWERILNSWELKCGPWRKQESDGNSQCERETWIARSIVDLLKVIQ